MLMKAPRRVPLPPPPLVMLLRTLPMVLLVAHTPMPLLLGRLASAFSRQILPLMVLVSPLVMLPTAR